MTESLSGEDGKKRKAVEPVRAAEAAARTPWSAQPELLGQPGLVLGAQALDGLVLRHLGGGDVPPRAGAGQVDVRDDRDDDDDRALVAAGLVERGTHLGGGVRPDAAGAEA